MYFVWMTQQKCIFNGFIVNIQHKMFHDATAVVVWHLPGVGHNVGWSQGPVSPSDYHPQSVSASLSEPISLFETESVALLEAHSVSPSAIDPESLSLNLGTVRSPVSTWGGPAPQCPNSQVLLVAVSLFKGVFIHSNRTSRQQSTTGESVPPINQLQWFPVQLVKDTRPLTKLDRSPSIMRTPGAPCHFHSAVSLPKWSCRPSLTSSLPQAALSASLNPSL